jgi:osmotically-inducible protein OsmY
MAAAALLTISMSVHASQMDDRIASSARKSYVFKTFLQNDDIKIVSQDGAVTLTGYVADDFNKSLAAATVAELPGVKSVNNRLEIKGTPPSVNSDEWLREKVKATLLFHRSVSVATTAVDVKEGIVTLRGEASSQAQKDLTTEYAKDIEGVKGVNNLIVVSGGSMKKTIGENIDDVSITVQVKLSLLHHRSTSAIKTKVESNSGEVTLYGQAGSEAEKDLATKLANDINGVKSVKNQMTVQ